MIQFKEHKYIKQNGLFKNPMGLHYLWSNMGDSTSFVGGDNGWWYVKFGRPHLLANLSIKGDFSLYQDFMKTLSDTNIAAWNCKSNKRRRHLLGLCGGQLLDSMFGLITAFLRFDLADNYRYPGRHMDGTFEALAYLLQPSLLLDIKKDLLKSMIPLTKKDLYNFDLYNNPRYHPRNRIKFLSKLVFSTTFTFSFLCIDINIKVVYPIMRHYINQLYNKFDYFKKMWYLSEYDDLRDNEAAQREIHSDFKKAIQTLMCFCDFYFVGRTQRIRENRCIETIKDYLIRKNINDVVSIEQNDKLFDIVPTNEDQINNLVDFLVCSDMYNDYEDGDFWNKLQHSRADVWVHDNFWWTPSFISFDRIDDVKQLLRHVWQLSK